MSGPVLVLFAGLLAAEAGPMSFPRVSELPVWKGLPDPLQAT